MYVNAEGGASHGRNQEAQGRPIRRDAGSRYRPAALVFTVYLSQPGGQRGVYSGGIRPDQPERLSGEEERGPGQGPPLYRVPRGVRGGGQGLDPSAQDEPLHQGLPAVPARRTEPGLRGEEAVQGQRRRGPGLHQVPAGDHHRQPARAHHEGDLRVPPGRRDGQLHQGHGDVHPPAPLADADRDVGPAPAGLLRPRALRSDQGRPELRVGVPDESGQHQAERRVPSPEQLGHHVGVRDHRRDDPKAAVPRGRHL